MVLGVVCGWAMQAHAQDLLPAIEYDSPNAMVQATVGVPWLAGLQSENWIANDATLELGLGVDDTFETFGGTWALRWRPDLLCFGCGDRVLVTLGVGPGGLVTADFEGGPWGFVVGGDLAASGVYWIDTTVGVSLTIHGGFGAGWRGTDFSEITPQGWVVGGLGLAF